MQIKLGSDRADSDAGDIHLSDTSCTDLCVLYSNLHRFCGETYCTIEIYTFSSVKRFDELYKLA